MVVVHTVVAASGSGILNEYLEAFRHGAGTLVRRFT